MCSLANEAGIKFEKECYEHHKKLAQAIKHCEDNEFSTEESVDYIFNSGLWLSSKADLAKCFK